MTFAFGQGKASHMMGVDLNYECINNCTIRVHLRAYRDCTGASSIGNNVIFTGQNASCVTPVALGPWSTQVTTEVTPVCPNWPTRCTSSTATLNGVQEFYWYRDYNICAASNCIFTLSWTDCCRNGSITSGAANQTMYIGATTLNTTLPICNSSAFFANPPVPYICAGQPFTFNQGAFDNDGDSLSYSLGPCFQSAGGQVTYNAGFSATAPLGSTWNCSIDAQTGDISLIPNPGSTLTAVLCVYVTEWRNGVAINNIVRDIQITVLNCPSNNLPSSTGVSALSGGVQNAPFEVTVCSGTPLSFNLPATDPNAGQVVRMYWNHNIPTGQFYETGNPGVIDTISGTNPSATFNWTPTTVGLHTFLITIKDDACPIIGRNQYTVKINVISGLQGASATWNPIGCTNIQFTANPGINGTAPFSYLWTGTGNIGTNPGASTGSFGHTYPGPSTYLYSVTITDNYGCTETIDDSLSVLTGPTADAGPDVSLCSGFTTNIGAPFIPGQTYSWSPPAGVSNPAAANPTVTLTNTGPGPITQTFTLTASDAFCTATDMVTITIYPNPVPTITGNLSICNGNSTTLTASGGSNYTWSTGATTSSITINPAQTTTYTVTAATNGCASPPVSATVTVSPGPLAIVSGPTDVCPGSSANLTVVGGTSWQWNTGPTTQTITLSNLQTTTTVSVTAANGTCVGPPTSYTVNILPTPVAGFVSPTVCHEQSMQFGDNTTYPNGLNSGWNWSFGDPLSGPDNTSPLSNPIHVFSGPGTYSTTLIVTAGNGCKDTISQNVTVLDLPNPAFSFSNVCEGSSVSFIDQTPGTISAWNWSFGDGSTSTQQNPTVLYASPNGYNVTLWVTDNAGCQEKSVRTVFVHPNPIADFSYINKCFSTITDFKDETVLNDPFGTQLSSWSWDFGNPISGTNNFSDLRNPRHLYSPGNYQATLTSTSSVGCVGTVTLPVLVESPQEMIMLQDTVCQGFVAELSIVNPYPQYGVFWFDNYTATTPIFIGPVFTTPAIVAGLGTYFVTVRDNYGCELPRTMIQAHNHPVLYSGPLADRQEVEIPNATVEFTLINYAQVRDNIVSVLWDFGDRSSAIEPSVIHQYTKEGVYDIELTLMDIFGCIWKYDLPEYIEVDEVVNLWVPNAFSPNSDEKNEYFEVKTQLITEFQIGVYDRWGKLMFESTNVNFRWDGKTPEGTLAPEGVYMYVIRGRNFSGFEVEKSGSVTLLR